MDHEWFFDTKHGTQEVFMLFGEISSTFIELVHVSDDVVEVVDEVVAEEFLQEGGLDLRVKVDVALLAVPGFELVFG